MFHWYYKQAPSTKQHDLGVLWKKGHASTMPLHFSNTFSFSSKWDAQKIPAVFYEIIFFKFHAKYLSQFKKNSKHKLSFFSLHALLNTPLHAQGIEEGLE